MFKVKTLLYLKNVKAESFLGFVKVEEIVVSVFA
jgi:hypothetical protein